MAVFHSIKSRLLWMGAVVVVFVVVVLGVTTHVVVQQYVIAVQEKNSEIQCRYQAEKISTMHQRFKLLMEQIAAGRPVKMYATFFQEHALIEYFNNFNDLFQTLVFLDKDGLEDIRVHRGDLVPSEKDWKDHPFYETARANPNQVFHQIVPPSSPDDLPMVYYIIVRYDYFDTFQGAVLAEVPMSAMVGSIPPTHPASGSYHLVLDADGAVLWGLDPHGIMPASGPGFDAAVKQAIQDNTGLWQGRSQILATDVFISMAHVGELDMQVLDGVSWAVFYEPLKMAHSILYGLGTALLVITLALAYLLSKTISNPLHQLLSTTQAVAHGRLDQTVELFKTEELGLLAENFNVMIHKLRKSRQELEEKVQERTAELSSTNQRLREQIEERKSVEAGLERALASLRKTQIQLVQSAKLASIGELAAGMAHELNQPLMVIRSNAQLLESLLTSDGFDRQMAQDLMSALDRNTKRMMRIIDHLRLFSRQNRPVWIDLDVNRVITDSLLLAQVQLEEKKIAVDCVLSEQVPVVKGDPNQFEQVILNLISNARDAINDFRARRASDDRTFPDRITIRTSIISKPDPALQISVSDTGTGIDSDLTDRIFDPFFTTKSEEKGTGLGLSISYGIVEKHQGRIEVEPNTPRGTTFRVLLPIDNQR